MKNILLLLTLLIKWSCSSEPKRAHDTSRPHVPGSIVVLAENCSISCLNALGNKYSHGNFYVSDVLHRTSERGLFELKIEGSTSLQPALTWLETQSPIKFASLQFLYPTPLRESSDQVQSSQTHSHIQAISGVDARQIERGKPEIIVAVTDDGFDLKHEDLSKAFFSNPGEMGLDGSGRDKSSNGIDDDNNGLIDDHQGWDFTGKGDNDPSAMPNDYHGTHIAGIIAANPDNNLGAEGVAPDVKILPIRFTGDGQWTALRVVKSYSYAMLMGARIISTSYSMEQFLDDPIFLAIIDEAYKKGLLVFNSAGNRGLKNPTRQKLDNVIFVGNTYSKLSRLDEINPNSNYGSGIDVFAPGDVYSTLPGNRYGKRTGTSMATPIAAAVAGLIWSQNPSWTRDQVIGQLLGSTDDITQKNPDKINYTGNGRINALKALTESPRTASLKLMNNLISKKTGILLVDIEGVIDPTYIDPYFIKVIDKNGTSIPLDILGSYYYGSNWLKLQIKNPKHGEYKLVFSKAISDPFQTRINKNTFRQYFRIVDHQDASPKISDLNFDSLEIPVNRSVDLSINIQTETPLDRIQVDILNLNTDTLETIHGVLTLNGQGNYSSRLRPQWRALPAGEYEIQNVMVTDDFGQDFVTESSFLHLPNFLILENGDYEFQESPIARIELPSVWGKEDKIPLKIIFKEDVIVDEISVQLRAFDSIQTLDSDEEFYQKSSDTLDTSIDASSLTSREKFYVSRIYLRDAEGKFYRFFGRPDLEFFIDSKLRNQKAYIVENIESDITPPKFIDANIANQNDDSNEVSIFVRAQDDESEIETIRVRISSTDNILESKDAIRLSPGLYVVTLPMPEWSRDGYYRIMSVDLVDTMGNKSETHLLDGDDSFYNNPQIFLKGGDQSDYVGPKVLGLTLYSTQEDKIIVSMYATDANPIVFAEIVILSQDSSQFLIGSKIVEANQELIEIEIDNPYGNDIVFYPHALSIIDNYDNVTHLKSEDFKIDINTNGLSFFIPDE